MSDLDTARPIYDISRSIALRGPNSFGWFVLIQPAESADMYLADLGEELKVQLNADLRVIPAAKLDVPQLASVLHQPSSDIVLVKGLEEWSEARLRALDVNRSGLTRPGFVILWLPWRGAVLLFQHAPNLRSWIGGGIFGIDRDLGFMRVEERRARIHQLSEHYGLNDDQVIAMAEAGDLPSDPEFMEWLILLGRADLAG